MLESEAWPELNWQDWHDTATTLHMWTQIVGKTRLALTPLENHWWNVPLYVSACGLTTSAMPVPMGKLEIEFDFVANRLRLVRSDGREVDLPLRPQSVASFFNEYQAALAQMVDGVHLNPMPVELKAPVRFDRDEANHAYDRAAVERFHCVLMEVDTLFRQFGTAFLGKVSPVHFFWGSFDLCVTRFNGRRAPARKGADTIQAEAYSHEVISAGFWPGNGGYGAAAFYCYAAPVPAGLGQQRVSPGGYDQGLGEFILRYDEARSMPDPRAAVLRFLESAYGAVADLAGWDRTTLERTRQSPA